MEYQISTKKVTKADMEINSEIADSLSDALRATDEAYGIAMEKWGEKDKRTETLLLAWAEVETAFKQFRVTHPPHSNSKRRANETNHSSQS